MSNPSELARTETALSAILDGPAYTGPQRATDAEEVTAARIDTFGAQSIRFYIGLNIGTTGEPIPAEQLAEGLAILDRSYAATTRTEGAGVWRAVPERTLIVEAIRPNMDGERDTARHIARTLAAKLDQECIGVTFQALAGFECIGAE